MVCCVLEECGKNMLPPHMPERAGWWYSCKTILMLTGGGMMGNFANSIDGQITRECMQMWVAAVRHNLSESVWHIRPLISTPVHHTTAQQHWRHVGDAGFCFPKQRSRLSVWSPHNVGNTVLQFFLGGGGGGPQISEHEPLDIFNWFCWRQSFFFSKLPHLGTRFERITS